MWRKKLRKEKRACGFFRVHVDNTLSVLVTLDREQDEG